MNTPIGWRNLWSEFPTSPAEQKAIRNRMMLGEDHWRTGSAQEASRQALEDAAQRWGVSLAPGLQFTDCGKPAVVGGEEFAWCGWSDPDGMQALSIEVSKLRSMRIGKEWGSAPWMLRRCHRVGCSVEQWRQTPPDLSVPPAF